MSRKVRGSRLIQTAARIRTHPTEGVSSGLTLEGEAADVRGRQAAYAQSGAATDFEQVDGFGRLEVEYPNGSATGIPEQPVLAWEMDGNDEQRDLFQHPRSQALGAARLKVVDGWLREENPNLDFQSADEQALYERYVGGNQAFYTGWPVLRKTMTVSAAYQISIAFTGFAMIWDAGSLINSERSMPVWLQDITRQVENLYNDQIIQSMPAGYVFGWLKKWPVLGQRWGQKVELHQEFWGGIWDVSFTYSQY